MTLIESEGGCPADFTREHLAAVVELLKKHGLNEIIIIAGDVARCRHLALIDAKTDGRAFHCALNNDDGYILAASDSLVPGAFIYELIRLVAAASSAEGSDPLGKLIRVYRGGHIIWCDVDDPARAPFTWADVELLLTS